MQKKATRWSSRVGCYHMCGGSRRVRKSNGFYPVFIWSMKYSSKAFDLLGLLLIEENCLHTTRGVFLSIDKIAPCFHPWTTLIKHWWIFADSWTVCDCWDILDHLVGLSGRHTDVIQTSPHPDGRLWNGVPNIFVLSLRNYPAHAILQFGGGFFSFLFFPPRPWTFMKWDDWAIGYFGNSSLPQKKFHITNPTSRRSVSSASKVLVYRLIMHDSVRSSLADRRSGYCRSCMIAPN